MNKCKNCGFEFDGNFCPQCGTKAEEIKVCPQCGAEITSESKFCTKCGYNLDTETVNKSTQPQVLQDTTPKEKGKVNTKLITMLKIMPVTLFTLLSIIVIALCAAPVAVFEDYSYGNVFEFIMFAADELEANTLKILLIIVVTLWAAGVLLALYAISTLLNSKNNTDGKLTRVEGVSVISAVIMFAYFILGCIICAQISALDGGFGFIKAGAFPICLIVFSVLFAAVSVGCVTARKVILRKNTIEVTTPAPLGQTDIERKKKIYNVSAWILFFVLVIETILIIITLIVPAYSDPESSYGYLKMMGKMITLSSYEEYAYKDVMSELAPYCIVLFVLAFFEIMGVLATISEHLSSRSKKQWADKTRENYFKSAMFVCGVSLLIFLIAAFLDADIAGYELYGIEKGSAVALTLAATAACFILAAAATLVCMKYYKDIKDALPDEPAEDEKETAEPAVNE